MEKTDHICEEIRNFSKDSNVKARNITCNIKIEEFIKQTLEQTGHMEEK